MTLSPSDSAKVWLPHASQKRSGSAVGGHAATIGLRHSPAKRVADSVHGSDEPRLLRVIVQRPPNLADQHVQIAIDDEDIGPDLAEQIGLRHDVRPLGRPVRTSTAKALGER